MQRCELCLHAQHQSNVNKSKFNDISRNIQLNFEKFRIVNNMNWTITNRDMLQYLKMIKL
jgi:hypothetical protein